MKTATRLVLALAVVAVISGCNCPYSAGKAGFKPLFNGKDLTGWVRKGGTAKYYVENGVLVGETVNESKRNTFLCTEKTFCDFILELEFKVDPELNSGIQFRSDTKLNKKGKKVVFGYQVEIDASEKPFKPKPKKKKPANLDENGNPVPEGLPRYWTGGIYDEARSGWLYTLHNNPRARAAFRQNGWNHVRVKAVGDSIKTWVNGVPAADLKDSKTACGFLGLQVHRLKKPIPEPMQVRFRNIRIKDLSASGRDECSLKDQKAEEKKHQCTH